MLYQQQPEWGDDMAQDLGDVVDKLLTSGTNIIRKMTNYF
jgi:hypothetical protein